MEVLISRYDIFRPESKRYIIDKQFNWILWLIALLFLLTVNDNDKGILLAPIFKILSYLM